MGITSEAVIKLFMVTNYACLSHYVPPITPNVSNNCARDAIQNPRAPLQLSTLAGRTLRTSGPGGGGRRAISITHSFGFRKVSKGRFTEDMILGLTSFIRTKCSSQGHDQALISSSYDCSRGRSCGGREDVLDVALRRQRGRSEGALDWNPDCRSFNLD